MRKIAAILLFGIYAFNLFGYHAAFRFLEKRAEQILQADLDKEFYNKEELITLTIPLSLPYFNDMPQFERIDGEIVKDGQLYHYVKRAVRKGMLVLLCLPNRPKMALQTAEADFEKAANGFPDSKSSKKNDFSSDLAKLLKAKYKQRSGEEPVVGCTRLTIELFDTYSFFVNNPVRRLPEQPPESLLFPGSKLNG